MIRRTTSSTYTYSDRIYPCPFCGAMELGIVQAKKIYAITCTDCNVTMVDTDADSLIEKWNRRTSDDWG